MSEIDSIWTKYQCIRSDLENALEKCESIISITDHIDSFKLFMRDHAACLPSNLLKQVQQYYRDVLDVFHSKVGAEKTFTFTRRAQINTKPLNKVIMVDQPNTKSNFYTVNSSTETLLTDVDADEDLVGLNAPKNFDQMTVDLNDKLQQQNFIKSNHINNNSGSFKLKSFSHQIILVKSDFNLKTATLSDLDNVRVVFTNIIDHSTLIENASNCLFVIECQQLRLRNCYNCQFYVNITGKNPSGGGIVLESSAFCYFGNKVPIISDKEDKTIESSLHEILMNRLFNQNSQDNAFDFSMVNDFEWISCADRSPNVLSVECSSFYTVAVCVDEHTSKCIRFIEITS